jgi:hypothetical protein
MRKYQKIAAAKHPAIKDRINPGMETGLLSVREVWICCIL